MDDLLGIGILAFRMENYPAAIAVLTKIDANSPVMWLARYYMGMSHEKLGNVPEARSAFRLIQLMCPDEFLQTGAEKGMHRLRMKPCKTAKAARRVHAKVKVYDLMAAC